MIGEKMNNRELARQLVRLAGQLSGPGIPDGTGPYGGTEECQMFEEEEVEEKLAKQIEGGGSRKEKLMMRNIVSYHDMLSEASNNILNVNIESGTLANDDYYDFGRDVNKIQSALDNASDEVQKAMKLLQDIHRTIKNS
jgi:hypothetical protein